MIKNSVRRIAAIITMLTIIAGAVFTLPITEVYAAAKKPEQVRKIKIKGIKAYEATVTWSKVDAPVEGYTVFRNGKAIKSVAAGKAKYRDTSLKASTNYTYYVKAYTYTGKKIRQWYNKETKKWQKTKPEKSIRGKTRLVNQKRYGKASPTIQIKTQKPIIFDGKEYKPSDFNKENGYKKVYTKKGTACPVCKEGVKVTITYDPKTGKYTKKTKGIDYSNKCHHHHTFEIVACEGDHKHTIDQAKTKCRWFRESDGREINPKTGAVKGTQTKDNHSDNFPKATISELDSMSFDELVKLYPNPTGDKKSVKCTGRKSFVSYKYCKDCEKIIP